MLDPDRFYSTEANRLGQPDLTILRSLDSVGGYGAVVDEHYDAETGTHLQLNLTPSALSGTTFEPTGPRSAGDGARVLHPSGRPAPGVHREHRQRYRTFPPVAPRPSAPADTTVPGPTPPGDYSFVSPPSPIATLIPAAPRTQYFGTDLAVTAVTVPLSVGETGTLRLGLVPPTGPTVWLGPPASGDRAEPDHGPGRPAWRPRHRPQGGRGPSGHGGPGPDPDGRPGHLPGRRLAPRHRDHPPLALRGHRRRLLCLRLVRGRRPGLGHRRPRRHRPCPGRRPLGDESIEVRTSRPAILVRSVQFATGWQATVTPLGRGGRPEAGARAVTVTRRGLVQAVAVPAGIDLVHFTYRPSRAYQGLGLSALGVLATILLAVGPGLVRRRRRSRL